MRGEGVGVGVGEGEQAPAVEDAKRLLPERVALISQCEEQAAQSPHVHRRANDPSVTMEVAHLGGAVHRRRRPLDDVLLVQSLG